MKKVDFFRKKYPRFVYESYSWKIEKGDLKISFDFKIESAEDSPPHVYFKPEVVIKNVRKSQTKKVGKRVLNNLVFNLGLIELLSYWKATCSPEILVKAGYLNDEQIKWWKNLIDRGMGQFFFENKINFRQKNFLKIKTTDNFDDRPKYQQIKNRGNKILVPVGGGKDSVVTLELLKKAKKEIKCFSLNPTEAAEKIMKIAGCKRGPRSGRAVGGWRPIIVERKINPKLLKLNQKGFLNGHTPFSAYLAFLSVLCAVLFDFKYIAFSNERSSNEGNVKYLGRIINHQYSKSFDFEQKFRNYSKKYLAKNVEYFSFLRPLYEIQIAKLFSKYPQYFLAFLSCNEAYKTYSGTKKPIRKWCCDCPKCLFVFASLYPFVETKKLIAIFGQNLFENPEGQAYGAGKKLLPIMLELIGERKFKPFECIGTKKESLIALFYSLIRANKRIVKPEVLLKYFQEKILPKYPNLEKESKKIMNSWNNQNNLSENFVKILKNTLSSGT